MFGIVLQDTWLFNSSIMENLRYGRLDATDEEIIKAAKATHVHNFVKTLPNQYQMELNDEATSSIDTRTEILIQKAIENLMKDGNIVERGNHEEVLKADGFYASLYNSQFESADAS